MRNYDEKTKNLFLDLLKTNEWGRPFYQNKVKPFARSLISSLTDVSDYPLEKLLVGGNSSSKWLAYFNEDLQTGDKYFALNDRRIFDEGGIDFKSENPDIRTRTESLFQLMVTCCHEFTHYEQLHVKKEKDIKKLSPLAILLAKEKVVSREDHEYYRAHHDDFLQEMDANYQGLLKVKEFVDSIRPTNPEIERIKNGCDKYMKEYYDQITEYVNGSDFAKEISKRFDAIIERLPQEKRKMYLDKMPSLTLVYNMDGSKRSYRALMDLKNTIVQSRRNELNDTVFYHAGKISTFASNINRTFAYIINCDKGLKKEKDDDYHSLQIRRTSYTEELKEEKKHTGITRR